MTSRTKHFLLATALFCYSNCLCGQESQNFSNKKLSVGIHVGAAFSDVDDNQLALPVSQTNLSVFDRKRPVNERLGVQVLIHIGEAYGLESGLFYEKNGLKAIGAYDPQTNTVNLEDNAITRFKYEYFTIPVLFKRLFNLEGATQISLHVGPYFGFLQSAFYSYKTTVFLQNPDGSIFESVKEKAFQIRDLTRQKDIGFRVRVGAERSVSDLATLFGYGF